MNKRITLLLVVVMLFLATSDAFALSMQFANAGGYQYIGGFGAANQKHNAFAMQKTNWFYTTQIAAARGRQSIVGYGWLEQGEEVSAKNKKVGWSVYAKNFAYGEGFQQIIGIGAANQKHNAFAMQKTNCFGTTQIAAAGGRQHLVGFGSLYQEEYVSAKNILYTYEDPMNIAIAGGYQVADGAAIMGQNHNAFAMQKTNWSGTTQVGHADGNQFMAVYGNGQQAQNIKVVQVQ